ncbi:hemagglutinin repeat-containing protein [Pseudomonas sp. DTU_2021_1001937_2_SI_NGA_ILE_001]|uniref:hemagglutinin repeat-containing protein n=1 Tax=Pseudomonas sp. DTU_2021_1001937_2_SI_NGA_ILE_001 TaxID=3077589 RepID=UPI0028FC118D|nr:hemagglutinin repeat-containing protein [Pseudomonas sp. DTU_2021_1001937_2_SI_NGA_ILE_001]WNW12251.1 hemagglutinin repeat-containing protein [Pseudomonas sp. DTU_2021_1001937_2_SI_NGA_ILE_001]
MDVFAPAPKADKPAIARPQPEVRRSGLQRALALILANAMFWQPLLVQAEGIVASNPATQVGQAGNGVPVVNIAAPNAAGVSHNQYQQYNVDAQGAILNNATGTAQGTQLGGVILGNPNLQGQAAGTILNEVTGANPSQLKGYTEVAGQAAKVIVANPHGITCNGCGFINTPQATLTTGKPVLDANGQVQRFNVQGGSVNIEGAGLNASNVDQFDIITRSARINAELHANKLNVITGRNDVDANTLDATPLPDDGSTKPELAIDSSALGGMYAGAVKLVGTEAGVGVKVAGDLAASGGDIQIDANGKLSLGQSAASGNVSARATDIDVGGSMYAGNQVQLNADKTLTNRKSITAGQRVALQARQVTNSGVVDAGVNLDNTRNQSGDVAITASNLSNSGSISASRDLTAKVSGNLDNRNGKLLSEGTLTTSAGQLDNRKGQVASGGEQNLEVKGTLNNSDGELLSDTRVNVRGGTLDNGNGTLSALKAASVDTQRLINRKDGEITSGGTLDLRATDLDNLGGMLSARDGLEVNARRFDNSGGTLVGNAGVTLKLVELMTNADGKVVAGGDLLLNNQGRTDNRNGRLSSQGVLTLLSAQLNNARDGVIIGQRLNIDAGQTSNSGSLYGKDRLQLRGDQLTNAGGEIGGGELDFGLAGLLNNDRGLIESRGALNVSAESLSNNQGQLRHTGDGELGLSLALLQNAGGKVSTTGTLRLSGARWNNSTAVEAAELDLNIDNLTQSSSGQLIAAKRLTGRGQSWTNAGLIASDGTLDLRLSGNYSGSGTLVSLDRLDLKAASLNLDGPQARLFSGADARIDTDGILANSGTIRAAKDLRINAGKLHNRTQGDSRGFIVSGGDMQLLTPDFLNQNADVYSLGDLQISRDAEGAQADSIVNRSGTLTSDGDMKLAAASLQNIRDVLKVNDAGIYSAQINELACGTAGTGNLDCSGGKEHHVWQIQQLEKLEVTEASDPSSITSGGNLTLVGQNFLNSSSNLGTAGTFTARLSNDFSNVGVLPGQTETQRTFISERTRSPGGWYALAQDFNQRYHEGSAGYSANNLGGLQAAMSNFIATTEREVTDLRTIKRTGYTDQSYAASIQAGGNVDIQAGNNFNNGAIQRGFTYVSGGTRTDTDAPGSAYATDIKLDSQLSPDLAQQQINPTSLPGFRLPGGQNGLFRFTDQGDGSGALLLDNRAGSHSYLIETNPALTDMRQFLGSDYLLDKLGINPDTNWKRLGDGYYEQRLLQQMLVSRTGQRYLDDLNSDEETFKYLMDNALASRDALNLSVGVSLTGEQVAALTHDIVWMEEQQVRGQRVLVPVLYLAQADHRLAPNGALIQGNDVSLISGNDLNNVGTLFARNRLSATANGNLVNSGLIQARGDLDLQADSNLVNRAGGVITGRNVSLTAKNGSVSNERTVTRHQSASGISEWREDFADSAARVESAGNLLAKAKQNVNNIGGVMQADGAVGLQAGQDVKIAAAETQTKRSNGADHLNSAVRQHGAQLDANQNLSVRAGRNVDISGSEVTSQGDLSLHADNDLRVASAANRNEYISRSKKISEENRSVTQQSSRLQANGNLLLNAGNDIDVVASNLKADGNVAFGAGQDITLTSALDEEANYFAKRKKGSFGRSSSEQRESYASTNVATQVEAGQDLFVNADKTPEGGISVGNARDVTIIGSQLKANNDLVVGASNNVAILSGVEEHGAYSEKKKSGFLGMSKSGRSELQKSATQVASQLEADGDVVVASGKDIRLRASNIDAQNDVELRAGLVDSDGDINLVAANDEAYSRSEKYRSKTGLSVSDGFVSISSARQAGREAQSSTSVGSQVKAERDAALEAERDINVVGSRIQAGRNVEVNAGRDVNILAAQNSTAQSDWQKKRQSGVGISGDDNGVTFFMGIERAAEKNRLEQQTAAASEISAEQDLRVNAKRDITQTGSDLRARKDIGMVAGRDIRVDAAGETLLTEQQRDTQRNGLSVALNHNFGSTKDAINGTAQGEDNVSKASSTLRTIDSVSQFLSGPTFDGKFGNSQQHSTERVVENTSRSSTLQADNDITLAAGNDAQVRGSQMRAGRDINVSGRDVTLDVAKDSTNQENRSRQSWGGIHGGTSGGFKLGVGGSSGHVSGDASQGSSTVTTLEAGRDINLGARNDLNLIGTQAKATRDLNLQAVNNLNIQAARNDSTSQDTRKSGGGEVGLAAGPQGIGVYASVNLGRGNLERENQRQQAAYLYAGDQLKFSTGQDANIHGAVLRGNDVNGRVGRNLNVSSAIDTGKAEGKEYDINATVTVGLGASVSGSVGYGRTNGSTHWVEDQTSITGKNSVDIRTQDHTQLDGALIAADSGKLKLDTGTLGFSDIAGKDKEHGYYLNVGGSYGQGARDPSVEGKGGKGNNWNLEGWNYDRDRKQTVRATVGAGEIVVRNDAQTGKDSTAGLNRDVDKAYEIDRDDEKRTDIYASSSSIKAALQPVTTAKEWTDQLLNYNETAKQNYEEAAKYANATLYRIERVGGIQHDVPAKSLVGTEFAENTMESLLVAGMSREKATALMADPEFQEKVLTELAKIAGIDMGQVEKVSKDLKDPIQDLNDSAEKLVNPNPTELGVTIVTPDRTAAQEFLDTMAGINEYREAHSGLEQVIGVTVALSQGPKGLVQLVVMNAIAETPAGQALLDQLDASSKEMGKKVANTIEFPDSDSEKLQESIPEEKRLIGGGELIASVIIGSITIRKNKDSSHENNASRETTAPNNQKPKEPCCFAAGTKVSTPDGDRTIESLKVGDVVWTKPEKGGKPFAARITATHVRNDQPIYRLTLKSKAQDGQVKRDTLLVTPSHPFYVPAQKDFIPVIDLKPGDRLQSLADGETDNTSSEVESLALYAPVGTTYNLTVDVGHTFYVGEFRTWVHNVGPCDPPSGAGSAAKGNVLAGKNIDDLSNAGKLPDPADKSGQLSLAGRALQKHGSRQGSAFPTVKGSPSEINAQGQKITDEILKNPETTVTHRDTGRFGKVMDVIAPDGRGLRYDSNGKFIGLLEPPKQ